MEKRRLFELKERFCSGTVMVIAGTLLEEYKRKISKKTGRPYAEMLYDVVNKMPYLNDEAKKGTYYCYKSYRSLF